MIIDESNIENYLVRECEKIGAQAVKFVPDYLPGFPDREVLLPGGRVCWVETKRPEKSVTRKLQLYRHKCLRDMGHDVYVCKTKKDVDMAVAEIQRSLGDYTAPPPHRT